MDRENRKPCWETFDSRKCNLRQFKGDKQNSDHRNQQKLNGRAIQYLEDTKTGNNLWRAFPPYGLILYKLKTFLTCMLQYRIRTLTSTVQILSKCYTRSRTIIVIQMWTLNKEMFINAFHCSLQKPQTHRNLGKNSSYSVVSTKRKIRFTSDYSREFVKPNMVRTSRTVS